ncbi:glycosyltransferase family A protein, partial [Actinomadura bangladeshensis]
MLNSGSPLRSRVRDGPWERVEAWRMESEARVGVVVPIYNVEPYLEECLASIARQSVRELDVVLVDDGSTDA